MTTPTEKVYVVTEAAADAAIAARIRTPGSDTDRALEGWVLEHGGIPGSGGGGTAVIGASPVKITDLGDGTALLEIVGAGATLTPSEDGTYVTLTIAGETP